MAILTNGRVTLDVADEHVADWVDVGYWHYDAASVKAAAKPAPVKVAAKTAAKPADNPFH